jgi:hypothetical protein
LLFQAMPWGTFGYTPLVTRKMPMYLTVLFWLLMSMMKPASLRDLLAHVLAKLKAVSDARYEDEANHEDSTSLLLVGDVASADAEQTCNDVWRNLEQC